MPELGIATYPAGMFHRLRDRLSVLGVGIALMLGSFVGPGLNVPALLSESAWYLGGLLTLWGTTELLLAPVRGVLDAIGRPRPDVRLAATQGRDVIRWSGGVPDQPASFVWIDVTNHAKRPQAVALRVRGDIEIRSAAGHTITFPARWRDSPMPWQVPAGDIEEEKPLRAGQHRQFDCAMKDIGSTVAFALNTDAQQAHFTGWHKPGWELPEGAYDVRVSVSGENIATKVWVFRLVNVATDDLEIRLVKQ
jgi:hypothetical protein